MRDFLYRGVVDALNLRFAFAGTTNLANEAVLIHGCDPISAHLLSRALTAAVLSSPMLAGDERLTIQWRYGGALRTILVDVGAKADVRGMIARDPLPAERSDKTDLYGDAGKISVIKSTATKQLNAGLTNAGLFDVVDDLAYFYSLSDQVETEIVVLVAFNRDVKRPVRMCQGFLLQAMPDCDLEVFDAVRRQLQHADFRARLGQPAELDNYFELLLQTLSYHDQQLQVRPRTLDSSQPAYICRCSKTRCRQALATLSDAELQQAAAAAETLSIGCDFCGTTYRFAPPELLAVVAQRGALTDG